MNLQIEYMSKDMDLSFAKSMSKNLSTEYSQKLLNSAKKPTTKATKTASKRGLQKKQKQLVI